LRKSEKIEHSCFFEDGHQPQVKPGEEAVRRKMSRKKPKLTPEIIRYVQQNRASCVDSLRNDVFTRFGVSLSRGSIYVAWRSEVA
jgi:hypothetical protein